MVLLCGMGRTECYQSAPRFCYLLDDNFLLLANAKPQFVIWLKLYILIVYTQRSHILKTAKLFKNGQSQAVRLPKEFRFTGERVFVKKIGNAVVLIPYQDSWQSLFESLDKFSDDFMDIREQPAPQEREKLFE